MPEAPQCPRDESLAEHFTMQMNAATSRLGVLSDIPIAFAVSAVLVVSLVLVDSVLVPLGPAVIVPIAFAPLLVCAASFVALRGARARVVAWIASVPFPIDNVNAVLSGAGEFFVLEFREGMPDRDLVVRSIESVCPAGFVVEQDEKRRSMSARFGIEDSRHNPIGTAHRRYLCMRRLVSGPLSDLHKTHPIAMLRFL